MASGPEKTRLRHGGDPAPGLKCQAGGDRGPEPRMPVQGRSPVTSAWSLGRPFAVKGCRHSVSSSEGTGEGWPQGPAAGAPCSGPALSLAGQCSGQLTLAMSLPLLAGAQSVPGDSALYFSGRFHLLRRLCEPGLIRPPGLGPYVPFGGQTADTEQRDYVICPGLHSSAAQPLSSLCLPPPLSPPGASLCWAPSAQLTAGSPGCPRLPAASPQQLSPEPSRDAEAEGEGGSWGLESAPTGPMGPLRATLARGEGAGQRCLAGGGRDCPLPPSGKFLTFFLRVCELMSECGGCVL